MKLKDSIDKLKNTIYQDDDYYAGDLNEWINIADRCIVKGLIPDVDLDELDIICKGDIDYLSSDTDLWDFYCMWQRFYKNIC